MSLNSYTGVIELLECPKIWFVFIWSIYPIHTKYLPSKTNVQTKVGHQNYYSSQEDKTLAYVHYNYNKTIHSSIQLSNLRGVVIFYRNHHMSGFISVQEAEKDENL